MQNIIEIDKQLAQLSPGGKNMKSPRDNNSDNTSVFNPSMSPNPSKLKELKRFRTLKKKASPKKVSAEDARKASLLEIFHFYSRQHIKANIQFDEFEESMKKIDLGEFTCFTRDFQIDLPRTKITECFRKSAINLQDMTFENFQQSIRGMGELHPKAKLRENKERLRELTLVSKQLKIPEQYPNT